MIKKGIDTLCICLISLYLLFALLSEINLETAIGKPAVASVNNGT